MKILNWLLSRLALDPDAASCAIIVALLLVLMIVTVVIWTAWRADCHRGDLDGMAGSVHQFMAVESPPKKTKEVIPMDAQKKTPPAGSRRTGGKRKLSKISVTERNRKCKIC